jgi:hypothetical protein
VVGLDLRGARRIPTGATEEGLGDHSSTITITRKRIVEGEEDLRLRIMASKIRMSGSKAVSSTVEEEEVEEEEDLLVETTVEPIHRS